MHSLHVITSDARRGAETFAVDLVQALESRGEHADIIALTPSGSEVAFPVRTLASHRRSPGLIAALRAASRQADVVVAHGSATLEACSLALGGTHRPFVYRSIGDPSYWASPAWRRALVGVMLRRAARVVALWPDAAYQIARNFKIRENRLDVIPNAVVEGRFSFATPDERRESRRRLGVAEATPCLAFVGALSLEKDAGTAIEAAAGFRDAVLLVVGDGPERDRLRRLAAKLAPGRVKFLGTVRDPVAVYQAADLLLLPSRSEGMPAVVIEAGLVGTPSVATRVGAVPTVIADGITGFLAPPNAPAEFSRRVHAALAERAEVGSEAASRWRGRYTIMWVVDRWASTLRRAVQV